MPSRKPTYQDVTLEGQRDLTRVLLKAVFVDVPNGRIVADRAFADHPAVIH